uniref:Integrin alpha-2 domain-containing protein n=1 Tax=Knipowitschia caucasica TaxID=637954 RepID=A0AAV2JY75_KNICA
MYNKSDVLIGAPRANTSGPSVVVERGAVYSCPWNSPSCSQLLFDSTDDRKNAAGAQMEFKSRQWFGASVRSSGEHILACAPLYQWSTYGISEREPVGTCFLKKGQSIVEYSPCRSSGTSPENQGFCQAGFSADFVKNTKVVIGGPGSFYWQGQLISDDITEIFERTKNDYINKYSNTMETRSAGAQYDDSYLGLKELVGDSEEVQQVGDSEEVQQVGDSEEVQQVGDSEEVQQVGDSEEVQLVGDSEEVQQVGDSEEVQQVGDSEEVQQVGDNEEVQLIGDSEEVQLVGESEEVQQVGDSEEVQLVGDSEEVQLVGDSEEVQLVGDSEEVQLLGDSEEVQLVGDSYSVTVADMNEDLKDDYITGVPRGDKALGYVNIFNGQNMESVMNFTGTQMAAYFGHSVAATDINKDGFVDLFVGAPLFMDRGSDGKLREVGQVSVYLGRGGFSFQDAQHLTGSEVYARFGSAITALGDLDMDGFNDIAISAPYGGPDHIGLVYIYNGRSHGPELTPSQVLHGKWASTYMPASFGYSMSGNTDIDDNGYPDLMVGVFGADKAVLYRSRPVISVNASLDLTPQIINPEDKTCTIPNTTTAVSCFKVKYCLRASGNGAPSRLTFKVDVTLDRLKQKEATKRVLFLHSKQSQYSREKEVTNIALEDHITNDQSMTCEELLVYLRDDREFRDKITPISVTMEYSLDYQRAADPTGLLPIVDITAPSNITKQAHILLDCGEDNICKPDLKLSVKSEPQQIYIGDDNTLTLEVSAENQGEGAYEAELHVFPPQQADFTGVVRNQSLSRLSCAYKKENNTKMVVCDLGNPMKGGTKVVAELRFSVHQLSEEDTSVKFDLQVVSSNQFSNTSPRVSSTTKLAVLAKVAIRGSSNPGQVLLPIANWKPREPPAEEDDIGPQILLVYELLNNGPSTFSKASLDVEVPFHFRNGSVLYVTSFDTEGPINCTTDTEINPLNVSKSLTPEKNVTSGIPPRERETEGRNRNHVIRRREVEPRDAQGDLQTLDCSATDCLLLRCQVGRLERGKNAIVFIYSRLDVNNFLRVENQNRSNWTLTFLQTAPL